MIDKQTEEKYSTPERFDRANKAEQFRERTDETMSQKARHQHPPNKDESRRPYKPIDYDDPPNDEEPGFKEW